MTDKKEVRRSFKSTLEKATKKNEVMTTDNVGGMTPNSDSFNTPQLTLFQSFFANTEEEKSAATNSIEHWDMIPKYHVSQVLMNKMRKSNDGQLGLLEVEYKFNNNDMKATIHPALIRTKDKSGKTVTETYYPSANEELVEEVLRKIASIQQSGFHVSSRRSGVLFTLNQVRQELIARGHSRTCAQIVQSINILSLSMVDIVSVNGKSAKPFARSAYFPVIAGVNRDNYNDDPHAKWYIEFHPLVTHAIDTLTYRQLDYEKLMTFKSQLGRWLHRWLGNKFTQAGVGNSFKIHYVTIKTQSRMLEGYSKERQAVKACADSMQELVDLNIARKVDIEVIYGTRNKISDVTYIIYPTPEFIKETKKANARHRDHLKKMVEDNKMKLIS